MIRPSDVLVISGLPGAGKTHYAKGLADYGWGHFEFDAGDPQVVTALNAAINGSDDPLLAEAAKYSRGLVFEWGFHTDNLPQVARMIDRGYNAWYFDGDREGAFYSWRSAHPTWDERLWHDQVDRLDSHWGEICVLYRSKIIRTVGPGPYHLPEEEIHRLLGLA